MANQIYVIDNLTRFRSSITISNSKFVYEFPNLEEKWLNKELSYEDKIKILSTDSWTNDQLNELFSNLKGRSPFVIVLGVTLENDNPF